MREKEQGERVKGREKEQVKRVEVREKEEGERALIREVEGSRGVHERGPPPSLYRKVVAYWLCMMWGEGRYGFQEF